MWLSCVLLSSLLVSSAQEDETPFRSVTAETAYSFHSDFARVGRPGREDTKTSLHGFISPGQPDFFRNQDVDVYRQNRVLVYRHAQGDWQRADLNPGRRSRDGRNDGPGSGSRRRANPARMYALQQAYVLRPHEFLARLKHGVSFEETVSEDGSVVLRAALSEALVKEYAPNLDAGGRARHRSKRESPPSTEAHIELYLDDNRQVSRYEVTIDSTLPKRDEEITIATTMVVTLTEEIGKVPPEPVMNLFTSRSP